MNYVHKMNINHVKASPVFQALWSLCAPAGFQSPAPNRSGIDLAQVPEARTRGDVYQIAPPIVTSEESIDRCVDIIAEATKAVLG